MSTILVPLDGSTRSEGALPIAARIARHTGAKMVLVRVVGLAADAWQGIMTTNPLLAGALLETDLEEAALYLERMATSPVLAGIPVHTMVEHGPPAARILAAVTSSQSDLAVLCRHGAGGLTRWAIGSVAEKVARHATTSVLIVREDAPQVENALVSPTQPLRMLVPLDGSTLAQAALEPGAALLHALAASGQPVILHLIQIVLPLPHMREKNALLSSPAYRQVRHAMEQTITRVQEGSLAPSIARYHIPVTWSALPNRDVASTLLRVAEPGNEQEPSGACGGYDLIAISTHGRGGLQRWVMGSIAERVMFATTRPLLIVHAMGSQESNRDRQ